MPESVRDGYLQPLDARVGRALARSRVLNLAGPLSRLTLSRLTIVGMPPTLRSARHPAAQSYVAKGADLRQFACTDAAGPQDRLYLAATIGESSHRQ